MTDSSSELPTTDSKSSGVRRNPDEEPPGPEREAVDARKGIFVRLSPQAKEILDSAARDRTYAEVIENLLKYYGVQQSTLKDKILKGGIVNPLEEFEDLLALTQTAQHAFENKRFYFAVKSYNSIADVLKASGSSEALRDVCNYRRAHCWIRLSYDLRSEGLKTTRVHSYSVALHALDRALKYLHNVKDGDEPLRDLIKHYNVACCYSLKAQYEVESKLGPETKDFRELRDAAEKGGQADLQTLRVWEGIGEDWRSRVSENDVKKVSGYAEEAYIELQKIHSPLDYGESTKDSSLDSERTWIIETAKKDTDLLFMRSDEEGWQAKFDDWVKAPPSDGSLAKAIEKLLIEVSLTT